jgi:hypothetical protein
MTFSSLLQSKPDGTADKPQPNNGNPHTLIMSLPAKHDNPIKNSSPLKGE